jgi:RNA polymerase sigma-70 factor (ECF subfamily)
MNPDSVGPLLEQLCQGDMAAAKEVFLAYEPYLRRVVRRQLPQGLRTKFDSIDIVQSVWATLLERYRAGGWHFSDVRRFHAFLVEVTRNRFIDDFRKHRLAYEKEQPLGGLHTSQVPAAPGAPPPDVMEAEELFEQMLALSPPEHRELLRLKRQGLSMDELTARTGLHPGSIRRILRNLARKLALQEGTASFNEEED